MAENRNNRFKQRFKGRQVKMTKDGITGIILNESEPINKDIAIYKQISRDNQKPMNYTPSQIQLPNASNIKYPRQPMGSKKREAYKVRKPYNNQNRLYGNKSKPNIYKNMNMDMNAYLDKLNINKPDERKYKKRKSASKNDLYDFGNKNQPIQYGNLRSRNSKSLMQYQPLQSSLTPQNYISKDQYAYFPRSQVIKNKKVPIFMPQQQQPMMLYDVAQSEKGGKKIYMYPPSQKLQQANQSYQGNYPYNQEAYQLQLQNPQDVKFKRQYYSTISDQRDLKKLKYFNIKKKQLNSFIAYATHNQQQKGKKKLRKAGYNVLTNITEDRSKIQKGPTYYKY